MDAASRTEEGSNQPRVTQAAPLAFRAINDLEEPKINQGQLIANIRGPAPILDFALKENRGGAESVRFIEVRMKRLGRETGLVASRERRVGGR